MEQIYFASCKQTMEDILNYIINKKSGIYLRFGDGDFNLAENKNDMLAKSNDKLKNMMIRSLSLRNDNVIISIPHHCKKLKTNEKGMFPGNHEQTFQSVFNFYNKLIYYNKFIYNNTIYSSVALHYCAKYHSDLFFKLHQELKKNNILFIGNKIYGNEYLIKLFGENIIRINTEASNAFFQFDQIFTKIDELMNDKYNKLDYFIIILAAGCASRVFSGELYYRYMINKPNFFIFDYGSLLDYLYGLNTRAFMKLDPINKKLLLSKI